MPSVNFTNIHIVKYGTPKENFGNTDDILFDDELKNRESWLGSAFPPEKIFDVLKALL